MSHAPDYQPSTVADNLLTIGSSLPPQERLRIIDFTSPFHDLVKHANYVSDFNEDVIRYKYSAGGGKVEEKQNELNKFWIASSSIYPEAERFTDRRELVNTAKALVNIVLSKSSAASSPDVALAYLEMLCAWMRKQDIYQFQDLTRDHVNHFLQDCAIGIGVASGLNSRLMKLLEVYEKNLSPPDRQTALQSHLIARKKPAKAGTGFVFNLDALSNAIGMRATNSLPRPFIEKFADLVNIPVADFLVTGYEVKAVSVTTLERVANTINQLSQIPTGFDTIRFFAFPDTTEEFFLKFKGAPRGRTENLSLDDAVEIMAAGATWIIDYAEAFFKLGHAAKRLLIKHPNSLWYHVPRKVSNEVALIKEETGVDLNKITGMNIKNFDDVIMAFHLLSSACVCVIYSNTARRKMEIASNKFGLTYGCLKKSELGVYSMRVYIEKTIRDYVTTGINFLAGKAIEVLQRIHEIYSDLDSDGQVADDQPLFSARLGFTTGAFVTGNYTDPKIADRHLPKWIELVIGNDLIQVRPHMWRRFYAVLYFYRYDFPQLSALSKQFFHFSESKTFTYITDKNFVEHASSISEKVKLHEVKIDGKEATAIEEFDVEYIKIFDSVAEEYMLRSIMKAAEGNASGGFVRSLIKRVADYVKQFNTDAVLTDAQRFMPLAKKLIREGHVPKPLAHGICFARESAHYEAHEAHCAKEGKIDRSQASCTLCSSCSNHGTHSGTMSFLEGEIAHFENILNDFSQSALKHEHAKTKLARLHEAKQYHLAEYERNKKITIEIFPVPA